MTGTAGLLAGDLGEAILECAETIVVTRFFPTPIVNGRKQKSPASDSFECLAAVQPMNGKELRQLPEGMRNEGRVKAYTTQELKTVQTSECKTPDRFEYHHITYEVDHVDDWSTVGGYYRVEAVRINR